ncbi:MAG: DUF3883 domain-containing protein, partial [Thermoplasmata archaeon]
PFDVRNQSYSFRTKFGDVSREYSKISFDKERAFKAQAEFVAMGHPLLESVVTAIISRCDNVAGRGATFLDPEGKMDGIVWFLEGEIRDGKDEIAGRRLFAAYQGLMGDESPSFVNPSVLWDLRPLSEREAPHNAQVPSLDPETITSYVISEGMERYRDELLERRKRDANVKRKYGIRSLESMILDSDAKISDYETRRMKGENIPEMTIQNERRRKEDLQQKKERLQREIEAEVHLYPTEPRIIGAVRVVPGKLPGEMVTSEEVEKIGMEVAIDYEKSQGREPEDVHLENKGYDISSKDSEGNFRYIEVKARAIEGAVALTPNEWLMAQRLGNEYWLYVVTNAFKKAELYLIQNPASKLSPEKEVSIVRYVVRDWKENAEGTE